MMARGGKAKRRIPSIPQIVTRASIWQSATTSHSCHFQSCVKGGGGEHSSGLFCSVASGIHQKKKKVFKLECTNNNKLDRWVLETLKFIAFLEILFLRQLSDCCDGLKWWSGWHTAQRVWQCCWSTFACFVIFGWNLPSKSTCHLFKLLSTDGMFSQRAAYWQSVSLVKSDKTKSNTRDPAL